MIPVTVLCPQCDLVVKSLSWNPGTKAECPRCHPWPWREPRRQPLMYALQRPGDVVLAGMFPFVSMKVAGIEAKSHQIPSVMFEDNYGGLALFFMDLCWRYRPSACLPLPYCTAGSRLPPSLAIPVTRLLFRLRARWPWRRFSSPLCWSVSWETDGGREDIGRWV